MGNNITRGLVGNKIDLQNTEVTKKEGKEYAEKISSLFCQTSAKVYPQGIIDFIYELCQDYVFKYGNQLPDETTFNIKKQKNKIKKDKTHKDGCC